MRENFSQKLEGQGIREKLQTGSRALGRVWRRAKCRRREYFIRQTVVCVFYAEEGKQKGDCEGHIFFRKARRVSGDSGRVRKRKEYEY